MKILHICPLYFPSIGGNQSHIQILSEKLVAKGHEVHVFTVDALFPAEFMENNPERQGLPEQELINGVHVHRFKVDYRLKDLLFKKIYKMRGGYRGLHFILGQSYDYWENGPLVPKMLGAIRRLKPDLVVAVMNYSYTTYVAYLAKKLFGYKLAIMPITHVSDSRSFHPFLKTMYRMADYLIACTDFEKKHLISQGVVEGKIKAWPIGIDPGGFDVESPDSFRKKHFLDNSPIVAYIGRKVTHKGVEALIQAMPTVWQKFPQAKLLFAGKTRANFEPVVKKHLDELKPQERAKVIDIGDFDETEKKNIFAAIDIFAMPSEIDSFGLVYLEAWLSGKPVIACRNTAQESIVDDKVNGLLVEYNNPTDLAKAICILLNDKDLRVKMGQAGRKKVIEVYNIEKYAETVEEGYRQWLTH